MLTQVIKQTISTQLDAKGLKFFAQQIIQLACSQSRQSFSNLLYKRFNRLELTLAPSPPLKTLINRLA